MKNKLMKIISLILCTLLLTPLFACDNTGDDGNNPPKQTNFYEEILTISSPKLYCYEQFDNMDDATAYAKTWRENYELFIPEIEEADSLKIKFITYRSDSEREKFYHKMEFEYSVDGDYFLMGNTTVYKKGELDKTKFHIETHEGYVFPTRKEMEYYYREDGKIGYTIHGIEEMIYEYGIMQDNFVIAEGKLFLKKEDTKTPQEIKAIILDNIVPVEEQKYNNKEISVNFILQIDALNIGRIYGSVAYENYEQFEKITKSLNTGLNTFSYVIKSKDFNKITNFVCRQISQFYVIPDYYVAFEFEDLQTSGEMIKVNVKAVTTPISLLKEEDAKMNQYSLVVTGETKKGYNITIKNGYGNIFNGTITAEDKTTINLEEIEQKILSNIMLVKGE